MKNKGLLAFLISAPIFGLVGHGATVRAGWTRHAVTGCSSDSRNVTFGEHAINNDTTWNVVNCVVPDTEERPAHQTNGAGVWIYDGSTERQVTLSFCSNSAINNTTACKVEGNDGEPVEVKHASVFGTAGFWREEPGHFKFIAVQLPAIQATRVSRLHGFSTF